eukprot:1160444-Pelagomonas_calceolata.AAC.14
MHEAWNEAAGVLHAQKQKHTGSTFARCAFLKVGLKDMWRRRMVSAQGQEGAMVLAKAVSDHESSRDHYGKGKAH